MKRIRHLSLRIPKPSLRIRHLGLRIRINVELSGKVAHGKAVLGNLESTKMPKWCGPSTFKLVSTALHKVISTISSFSFKYFLSHLSM